MATWIELQATKTADELQTELLAAMNAAGLPTETWVVGGRWHNLTLWVARLLVVVYGIMLLLAKAAWLDTATGQGLSELAEGTFGTPRRIEASAVGTVTILNNSGLLLDEDVDSIFLEKNANTEITYKNTEAIYLPNGDQGTFSFRAQTAGTIGNAIANGVSFVSAITGVTIVSSSAFVGQDAQTDAELRSLASKQASVLGTAHANKYEWIALNTNTDGSIAEANDGKTRCNINRVKVFFEDAECRVYVWLASSAGAVDAGEYATTIATITQYALTNPGILIDSNVTPVTVDVDASIIIEYGKPISGITDLVQSLLEAYFPVRQIGNDISLLQLATAMGRAHPDIKEVLILTPIADIVLAADEVAVLGTVTLVAANEVPT